MSHLFELVPVSDPDTALLRPKSSHLSLGSLERLVADDGLDGGDLGEKLEHGREMGKGSKNNGESGVVGTIEEQGRGKRTKGQNDATRP